LASDNQNDTKSIQKLYCSSFEISLLVFLPTGFGLAYISSDLVQAIFPTKWLEVSDILAILAIAGIFGSVTRFIEQLYKGVGAVKENFYILLNLIGINGL
jgi:O-antigen/teichoic acid export membrane protein